MQDLIEVINYNIKNKVYSTLELKEKQYKLIRPYTIKKLKNEQNIEIEYLIHDTLNMLTKEIKYEYTPISDIINFFSSEKSFTLNYDFITFIQTLQTTKQIYFSLPKIMNLQLKFPNKYNYDIALKYVQNTFSNIQSYKWNDVEKYIDITIKTQNIYNIFEHKNFVVKCPILPNKKENIQKINIIYDKSKNCDVINNLCNEYFTFQKDS